MRGLSQASPRVLKGSLVLVDPKSLAVQGVG